MNTHRTAKLYGFGALLASCRLARLVCLRVDLFRLFLVRGLAHGQRLVLGHSGGSGRQQLGRVQNGARIIQVDFEFAVGRHRDCRVLLVIRLHCDSQLFTATSAHLFHFHFRVGLDLRRVLDYAVALGRIRRTGVLVVDLPLRAALHRARGLVLRRSKLCLDFLDLTVGQLGKLRRIEFDRLRGGELGPRRSMLGRRLLF